MAWQDTGVEAGAEVEAAKAAALAAFMAAPVDSEIGAGPAVPPQISRTTWTQTQKLSSGDVVKLLKVVNAAIMDATLKHIGPVSSDSSITIGIQEVGGIKKLDLRATGRDDHKVGVSVADIAASKWGPLADKTRGDNITITAAVQTDPTLGEQVVFSTIAQADPITFASTLYAAHIDDPKIHASVAAAFYIVTGSGNEAALFEYDWTNVSPGVWRCNIIGTSILQAYCRGVTPVQGMRIWAGFLGLDDDPLVVINPEDEPHTGIYEIVDPGIWYDEEHGGIGVSTYAVVRRVPDLDAASEFAPGVVVQITGGDSWSGKYANLTTTGTITLETTPLEWSKLDSYTMVPSDNLLTASQLAQASETPNTAAYVASDGSPSAWLTFPTLAGTPNLDTYNAGRTEVQVKARIHIAGEAGSISWLECQVIRDPGGADTVLETINTSPITSTTDEVITAHVDDATDQDLAGDGIALRIRACSDSSTSMAIAITWSDPEHSTRLLTPLSLAVGGTTDHQALEAVSRGFDDTETEDARTYRHPQRAIAPGRWLGNTGASIATIDGLLTIPAKTNSVVISGDEPFRGINISEWPEGSVVLIEFSSSRPILNYDGAVPPGYAAINCSSLDFATPDRVVVNAGRPLVLQLMSSNTWTVLSAPWVEAQRWRWPLVSSATIETGDGAGALVIPQLCTGVVKVAGSTLRAIAILDEDGNAVIGNLAQITLYFTEACTIYHLDSLSGMTAPWQARVAQIDTLPDGLTGNDQNALVAAHQTVKFILDTTTGDDPIWYMEVAS